MNSVLHWLATETCPVVYDDWSDDYTWSCMMRVDGRYSAQKVPDEVGNAIHWRHNFHHDVHTAQIQDWCIGVRELIDIDLIKFVETVCSHEVEEDDSLLNDWIII